MGVTWWIVAQTAARHTPNNLVCVIDKGVSLERASLQSGGAEEEEEEELLSCCDCMALE